MGAFWLLTKLNKVILLRLLFMDRPQTTSEDPTGEGRALVKFEMDASNLRRDGGFQDDNSRHPHAISFKPYAEDHSSIFDFENSIRAQEDAKLPTRLFTEQRGTPGLGSIVIPGLDLTRLYQEAKSGNPWDTLSVTRVFTGEDQDENLKTTPYALPLGFYLERLYIKTIRGLWLSHLQRKVAEKKHEPLPPEITRVHAANLTLWHAGEHLPRVAAAPTRRPFIEAVYRSFIRDTDGDPTLLFGNAIWEELQAHHREIMAVKEDFQY